MNPSTTPFPETYFWSLNLSDSRWSYRYPFYAMESGSGLNHTVMIDDTDPTQTALINGSPERLIDQEINYANNAGIDYFAVCYYGTYHQANEGNYDYFINMFRNSTAAGRAGNGGNVHIAYILQGGRFTDVGNFAVKWTDWLNNSGYIGDDIASNNGQTYQFVDIGGIRRPLVFIQGYQNMLNEWGGLNNLRQVIMQLRIAITSRLINKAPVANPYIVAVDSPDQSQLMVSNLGADAVAEYSSTGTFSTPVFTSFTANVFSPNPYPHSTYQQLTQDASAHWNYLRSLNLKMIPTAMAGFDPRPRWYDQSGYFGAANNPTSFGIYGSKPYYDDPQAPYADLRAHLAAARAFVKSPGNTSANEAQTVLLYAWDEFDEGGHIMPAKYDVFPTARLDAVHQAVLGVQSTASITTLGTWRTDFSGWVGFDMTMATTITPKYAGYYCGRGDITTHQIKVVNGFIGNDAAEADIGPTVSVACDGLDGWKYAAITLDNRNRNNFCDDGADGSKLCEGHEYYVVATTNNAFYDQNTVLTPNGSNVIHGGVYYDPNNPSAGYQQYRPATDTAYGPVALLY